MYQFKTRQNGVAFFLKFSLEPLFVGHDIYIAVEMPLDVPPDGNLPDYISPLKFLVEQRTGKRIANISLVSYDAYREAAERQEPPYPHY